MMFNPLEEIPAFCHKCGPQPMFLRHFWHDNGSDLIKIYFIAIDKNGLKKIDSIKIIDQNIADANYNDQCMSCGHYFPYNVDLDLLEDKELLVGFRI